MKVIGGKRLQKRSIITLLSCLAIVVFFLFYRFEQFDKEISDEKRVNIPTTDGEKSSTTTTAIVADANGKVDWLYMEKLPAETYYKQKIQTGLMADCYGFIPEWGKLDNCLEIQNKSDHDALIKVMQLKTEKCVRFVAVLRGEKYQIKKLPPGKYYLKIGHGTLFIANRINGKCVGFFDSFEGIFTGYLKEEFIVNFRWEHKKHPVNYKYEFTNQTKTGAIPTAKAIEFEAF